MYTKDRRGMTVNQKKGINCNCVLPNADDAIPIPNTLNQTVLTSPPYEAGLVEKTKQMTKQIKHKKKESQATSQPLTDETNEREKKQTAQR